MNRCRQNNAEKKSCYLIINQSQLTFYDCKISAALTNNYGNIRNVGNTSYIDN